MTNTLKYILAGSTVLLLSIIVFFVLRSDSSSSKQHEEDALSPQVDTQYSYEDMMNHNDSRKDEYTEHDRYSTPTEQSTNTHSEKNIEYIAEEDRIRKISQNIERGKPSDVAAVQHQEERPSTPVLKRKKVSQGDSDEEDQHDTNAPKIARRASLFNDSWSEKNHTSSANENSYITAVIHGEQSVRHGSAVKLRTTQEFSLEGKTIPKNTIIFGYAALSDGRLNINIDGFRADGMIFSRPLIVLDQDGAIGLRLVGGHGEGVSDKVVDVADQSTNNILSTVPVVGSIAQGTKELLRNRRTENAKPIYLGSNQKVLLKII
ncbi:MAG: conjugative transposon protein TraM [Thiothrix sp.]|nr:MAG: conjugative transposon protein TraM [Thiothrix sp.]